MVHALVLATLARGGAPNAPDTDTVVVELTADAPNVPAAAAPAPREALPDPPLPSSDEAPVPRPLDAPEGDRDNAVSRTVAPHVGDGREREAPAPDRGDDGGHAGDVATRHDRSTLQSRIADANDAAQPSHLRTSARSSSPQAVRREAKTGVGDSVRTSEASRAPSAATPDRLPSPEAAPDVAGPAAGAKDAARVEARSIPRVSDHPTADQGVGPLAAEGGARSFDVEARGRVADDRTRRAASNAAELGITDYSHAGAPAAADSLDGHGPGVAPGAVSHPSEGTSPALFGARAPDAVGADAARRTREREYDRYRQGIARRLGDKLVFPRQLLVHLEQGETVVTFVVHDDGTLGARPHVVKSSGFPEFDSEAVDVVVRAAPFGRRAEKGDLTISLPVTFENPVVR
ncbi:MAG TPA: TonB family protein [Polyangia bacterium]|nr:TonB family protein [Polyangia bacterium]